MQKTNVERSKPCETAAQAWTCRNMQVADDDVDPDAKHFECKVCGRRAKLDYEEMK